MAWKTFVLVATVIPILSAARAQAFNSYPPGAPHDQITRAATRSLGWSSRWERAVEEANRGSDRSEMRWKPGLRPSTWLRFVPNDRYSAAHHFDRGPGRSSGEAFADGRRFVTGQLAIAVDLASRGDSVAAVRALGRGLHALQDCFAHSNYAELDTADAARVRSALFDLSLSPPPSLLVTGYDPSAADPEEPAADPYPHRSFAKDAADKNAASRERINGKTAYDRAYEAAIDASIDFLRRAGWDFTARPESPAQ